MRGQKDIKLKANYNDNTVLEALKQQFSEQNYHRFGSYKEN